MARVGFCINGFAQSTRDSHPFHFPDDTGNEDYRIISLDRATAFEYVSRAKAFFAEMDLFTTDDTVSGDPVETELAWSQGAERVFSGNEQNIHGDYFTDAAWPDWTYGSEGVDPFYGAANVVFGGPGVSPLAYFGENSFSPHIICGATLEGGDVGDRGTIAQISTVQLPGFVASAVQGFFMSDVANFLVYEANTDPLDHPVTGEIHITAVGFWGYTGVWDTSDGSQLITPIPGGF